MLHEHRAISYTDDDRTLTIKTDMLLKFKDETTRKRQRGSGGIPEGDRKSSGLTARESQLTLTRH